MALGPIDIHQLVRLIEEKGGEVLLPRNLPDKWLGRLSEAAIDARKRGLTPPLAIRIAVLSLKERRAVKEKEAPKREKKYDALDFEAWVLLYSRDLEFETARRQGADERLKDNPAYLRRVENPPTLEDYFEH